MPNDKTFSIPLHETWPEVPGPFCLNPWTRNRGPWALDLVLSNYCWRCLSLISIG